MKIKNHIQFINHASYLYECNEFIFICDPWVEGTAFNNGWNLLDNSTSNEQLISRILETKKPLYIWYSHEHSDHFSISFLKKLKFVKPKTKFFFQSTHDNRLVDYLNDNQFSCTILKNYEKVQLSPNSWLSIHSWRSGDSLCVMQFNGVNILNLNDCIISSLKDCVNIKKILNKLNIIKLDILFTQFGYASWTGNEDDIELRKKEAEEKLNRIASQIEVLSPERTVLFASYVYFSNKFNFYLNDSQNTPLTVRASKQLSEHQNKIYFLKPWDTINLGRASQIELKKKSKLAEKHWQYLYSKAKIIPASEKICCINDLVYEFKLYKKKITKNFLGIFSLIEMIGLIKPLNIKILDLNQTIELSYIKGATIKNDSSLWDIAMSSSDLMFSITKEFGFDCTHVNGRFRTGNFNSNAKFLYFAGPQNMLRMGFGFKKPVATVKELFRLALR